MQYCQREGRAIIWLNEKTENNQKILSAYLTNAEGQTTFQFDTEQLFKETGMDWIMDIYCTAEEKVVLIAKDTRTHVCRLYEFYDGAFQLLYDGYVDGSFSVWGEELLFTALSEASVCESTPQAMVLNLQDDSMFCVK